jgi:hypothetical protein
LSARIRWQHRWRLKSQEGGDESMSHRFALLLAISVTAMTAIALRSAAQTPAVAAASGLVESLFMPDGRLQVPVHYREWVFLSAGIDMSYRQEKSSQGHSMFDNVFVDPTAYRAFMQTGRWPEHTLLVMEDRGATEKGSINQRGKFQTRDLMGIEAHVKDSTRFAGGWGFFFWATTDSQPAQPIPKTADCYACHEQHGAVDTTFVQFYPTLLSVAISKQTLSPSFHP